MVEFLDKTGLRYLWGKIKATFYQKPSGGIPKSDLSSAVQTSLGKADTALQSHQDISGKVDKVTSTDNAVVRFNGTSGAIQNSGVTIDDSNYVKAAKFITSGGTTSHVVRGDGSLAASKELPQYEAYLEWGGKNHNDACGPLDAALIYELGAPKTFWVKPAGVIIEYSTDGGETWIDYGVSDSVKNILFSTGNASLYTGNTNVQSVDNLLRITLEFPQCGLYAKLCKFAINISRGGAINAYCTIRGRKQTDVEAGNDAWTTFANKALLAGESGWNIINVSKFRTYANTKSQYGEVQFIFGSSVYVSGSYGVRVNRIIGYGDSGWVFPSNMAQTGHLYAFDASQNATFPANVTAVAFKKTNGTSSQFLKADGSVDSNAYLTSSDLPAAITDTEMDSVLTEVEEEEAEVVSE